MKCSLIVFFSMLLSAGITSADIIPEAYYSLGELAGHSTNNLPIDASGNGRNFVAQQQGSLANLVGIGAHALSPSHVATPANTGWWGADLSTIATDNFAFGVWARASNNAAAENGDVLTTGGGANSNYFRLSLSSSGWGISSEGNAWTANSTFTPNEWAHLMLIRRNGVAQFFVNGSEIGPTFNGAVQHFNAHLSVNPNFTGGAYAGDIDEVRVVTFNPVRTNNEIYQFVALGIPEPSSALVIGGTLILVCSLRRRPC